MSENSDLVNAKEKLRSIIKKYGSLELLRKERNEGNKKAAADRYKIDRLKKKIQSIEQRNGKIYISLEEDLLFESGKYIVNQNGVNALNKLSSALANQLDIEILVEGHTDNIQGSGRGAIKDNWDLSVMRATSVVKILLENQAMNPLQLTAAGRGEHNPIATNETPEGRKMN